MSQDYNTASEYVYFSTIAFEKQYCLSEYRGWGGHTTLFVLSFIHYANVGGQAWWIHITLSHVTMLQLCSKIKFFKKMLQKATSYHECCSRVHRNVKCSRLVWPQHYCEIIKCASGITSQSKEATGDNLWRSVKETMVCPDPDFFLVPPRLRFQVNRTLNKM